MQGSKVSRALCFDMRFPAGGVTGCRTETHRERERGAAGESGEVRCHTDVYVLTDRLFLWLQTVSHDSFVTASLDRGDRQKTLGQ